MSITNIIDNADYRLNLEFRDLTRDEQAVLAFATLLGQREPDGCALLADIADGLSLAPETVLAVVASLYDKCLAYRTGPTLDQLDRLMTRANEDLLLLALGAGGRPSAREWARLREEVFDQTFGDEPHHCLYCKAHNTPLVLDHRVPVSKGGSNHPLNLVPACAPCNGSKGSKTVEEWWPTTAMARRSA